MVDAEFGVGARSGDGSPVPPPSPPAPRRWMHRRVAVGVVVVVVAVSAVVGAAVGLGWLRSPGSSVTTLGPDEAPFSYPGLDSVSAPAPVGVSISFGSLVLTNTTDTPITITSVRILESDDGVTVMGVALDPGQQRKAWGVGSAVGFPATNPGSEYQAAPVILQPGAGAAPRGVDVVVGLRPDRPGRWHARGIEVAYSHDGREYTTTYPNTLVVCTDLGSPCLNGNQAPAPWTA